LKKMDPPLKGKVAWVTGSSRGMSRVTAAHLAGLGASVAVHGTGPYSSRAFNKAESLEAVAREISSEHGTPVLPIDRNSLFGGLKNTKRGILCKGDFSQNFWGLGGVSFQREGRWNLGVEVGSGAFNHWGRIFRLFWGSSGHTGSFRPRFPIFA